jgi:hypothetical protein
MSSRLSMSVQRSRFSPTLPARGGDVSRRPARATNEVVIPFVAATGVMTVPMSLVIVTSVCNSVVERSRRLPSARCIANH